MTQVERRGCAYHEAGHAVVGRALGRRVSKVEIGIDGEPSKGHTHFDDEVSLCITDGLALLCAGLNGCLVRR
jgi:ATP-dependent Zn protease